MNQPQPIPKLDLAPKLNRPLSLWNPLDYLRLLYWVFFFPQAVRWYIETYGGGESLAKQTTLQEKLEFLRQHPNQLKLCIQGLLLIVFVPLFLLIFLKELGFFVDWWGLAFSLILGLLFGLIWDLGLLFSMAFSLALGLAFRLGSGLARSLALGLLLDLVSGLGDVLGGVALGLAFGTVRSLALGLVFGLALGVRIGMVSSVAFRLARGTGLAVTLGMALGVVLSVAFGLTAEVNFDTAFGVAYVVGSGVGLSVACGIGIFRPENWLIFSPLNLRTFQNRSWLFPRITPIPLPLLTTRLKKWLRQDWQMGLENANELLRYSLQFIPVVNAINQVLAEIPPEQLIFRVSQLAEDPYDWKLLKFASASLQEELKRQFKIGILFWRYLNNSTYIEILQKNTLPRATSAGFWLLHKKDPEKATEAFAVVRSLLYGEEMYILAQTLTQFKKAEKPNTIAEIELPNFPQEPLLRQKTWNAVNSLRRVVEDVKLVLGGTSKSGRSFALNRAIGELKQIIDNPDKIPKAEQGLIVEIAQTWTTALEGIALDIGKISITERVKNPYVIGDPVEGSLFVGRDDIMRELEQRWVKSKQLQSVAIYGHRRMGKTSILLNIKSYLVSDVRLAYINLQSVGNATEGVGEVLMAIADGISETVDISPPNDDDLLHLPYPTFRRYLKQIEAHLVKEQLIIALDEFENIENLIQEGKISSDILEVLRSWVQMSPKIAFAIAGLHTLEEMIENYDHPFFCSISHVIKVSFLSREMTRYLLSNPDEDFLLTYKLEALDLIYDLTFGQPYLVQMIGFSLVRRYNEQVFELGQSRNSTFTVEDVETVINDSDFFNRGRYYFTGVWNQAAQGSPKQQDILKVLAEYPEGFSIDKLLQRTGLDETILNDALNTLKRHDVVCETGNHWKIIVELFRRWVVENFQGN